MTKEKILIGWSSRDITPSGKVSLLGQFHVRITDRVHDPLYATALAIEGDSGREQAIIVSIDAVSVSEEVLAGCRHIIAERIPDFSPDKLFISATHTHTAPEQYPLPFWPTVPISDSEVMDGESYGQFLIERISAAAIEAWEKRAPGGISWGKEYAVIGFNRRVSYFDGSSEMYGKTDRKDFSHIEGHEDHSINLLFTYDTRRKLTGMVINVPCPAQSTENASFISADYWYETRTKIREQHGEELFILPQCSAAGDLSPHCLINREADRRMMRLKGYGSDYTSAHRQDIAEKIAAAVDATIPLLSKEIAYETVFKHQILRLELPRRQATAADLQLARQEVQKWQKELDSLNGSEPTSVAYSAAFRHLHFFRHVMELCEEQQKNSCGTMPVELHILRIGDIGMASNRFEYYLDFGERIKARSRALQTFIVQLAGNGSYLPTARSLTGGSYGAYIASTPVGPTGGQIIVEETVKTLNAMFDNHPEA